MPESMTKQQTDCERKTKKGAQKRYMVLIL